MVFDIFKVSWRDPNGLLIVSARSNDIYTVKFLYYTVITHRQKALI